MTYRFKSRSQAILMGMGSIPTWKLCPPMNNNMEPMLTLTPWAWVGLGMGMGTQCRALVGKWPWTWSQRVKDVESEDPRSLAVAAVLGVCRCADLLLKNNLLLVQGRWTHKRHMARCICDHLGPWTQPRPTHLQLTMPLHSSFKCSLGMQKIGENFSAPTILNLSICHTRNCWPAIDLFHLIKELSQVICFPLLLLLTTTPVHVGFVGFLHFRQQR